VVDVAAILVGGVLVRPRDGDGAGRAVTRGRDGGAVFILAGVGRSVAGPRDPDNVDGRDAALSPGGAEVGGGSVPVDLVRLERGGAGK
jgi:hypothetical protein